jgi:putative phosphoribosyl transferase
VVLALPRGGVPVAAEVAAAFDAPLDVLVVRKLGLPSQPELAIGAVASGAQPDKPVKVLNEILLERSGLSAAGLEQVTARELAELRRREQTYRGDRPPVQVAGRTAVLVDDGLATGASARAALLALREHQPDGVVLAVPVAPRSTLVALADAADQVVCAAVPRRFVAVGRHYADFGQVTDAEVHRLLDRQH